MSGARMGILQREGHAWHELNDKCAAMLMRARLVTFIHVQFWMDFFYFLTDAGIVFLNHHARVTLFIYSSGWIFIFTNAGFFFPIVTLVTEKMIFFPKNAKTCTLVTEKMNIFSKWYIVSVTRRYRHVKNLDRQFNMRQK